MPLNEHAIHFDVQGQRLWGMLHLPVDVQKPVPAVLILHGFTGQRMEPHRLFVLFSRLLAEHGIASMRFDFRGSGESEGVFDEMTPSREVEDVVAAYAFLKSRAEINPTKLGLLGLSMGGMVAALSVAQPGVAFKALSLWAPAHPSTWLGELPSNTPIDQVWATYQARAKTPEGKASGIDFDAETNRVDFYGNPVSQAFFDDLLRLDSFQTVVQHQGPALVVHGTADPAVSFQTGETYAKRLETRGPTQLHAIPGGLHTFEKLGAQREAHAVTLEFFKSHLL
jgi:uncharacterized protein